MENVNETVAGKAFHVLAGFGDSIMKGVILRKTTAEGRPEYELTKQSILERCGKLLGIDTVNYARFGCTAPMGSKLVERYGMRLNDEQTVLIGYGGNDSDYDWEDIADHPDDIHHPKTSMFDFVRSYHQIINRIRQSGATPVMLTMPPMDADRYFNFFTRNLSDWHRSNILKWLGGSTKQISLGHELYNKQLYAIAQQENVRILDVTTDLMAKSDWADYLCADGIHPNEKGQICLAETIANQLRVA